MDILPCACHMDKTESKLVSMYLTVIEQQQLKYLFLHHTSYTEVGLQNTVLTYVSCHRREVRINPPLQQCCITS